MKQIVLFIGCSIPLSVFAQNEVEPEGYKLGWMVVGLIVVFLLYVSINRFLGKTNKSKRRLGSIARRELKIELIKDRQFKPNVLTLKITNSSKSDVDLEAPVLSFRKIWTKRKFKLKGINQYEIYPLFLEAGKIHELHIDLGVFYNHDRKLKRFYWAKIRTLDTNGKKYSSSYVTLRKSLIS